MARNYSSNAQDTTLAGSINDTTTSITVAATTGFPSVPFILAVDAGSANQELVLVTAVGGTTLTVTRGYDSTSAVAHDTGAVVRHVHAAIDFREAAQTATDLTAHEAEASGTHGVTGSIVGTTDTQTLTNKTVNLASNTLSGTAAQFNTALSDDNFLLESEQRETSVNRMVLNTFTIADPTVNTVMSNATERTAMTTTFTKRIAASALVVDLHVSFNNSSGLKQVITWGVRINGADYDITRGNVEEAPASLHLSGTRRLTGIGAGALTIEPFVRSASGIVIEVDSAESFLSYTVREVA